MLMLENFLPRRKQMNSLVPPKCHILFNFKHSEGCSLRTAAALLSNFTSLHNEQGGHIKSVTRVTLF